LSNIKNLGAGAAPRFGALFLTMPGAFRRRPCARIAGGFTVKFGLEGVKLSLGTLDRLARPFFDMP
jgi:hypothetical protein